MFYFYICEGRLLLFLHDDLIQSIKTKLFTLDNDIEVLCGHGENTTIGFEKNNNPFFKHI